MIPKIHFFLFLLSLHRVELKRCKYFITGRICKDLIQKYKLKKNHCQYEVITGSLIFKSYFPQIATPAQSTRDVLVKTKQTEIIQSIFTSVENMHITKKESVVQSVNKFPILLAIYKYINDI